MVGASAATNSVIEDTGYAARCDAKVLITGESGVGKEIVARMIHERSARARGPFVTINCASFPDSLLESELFGHVKGSFTGADRDKRGWLEAAHTGTIFMDEVGEMSLRMQATLLRFLETGEIQRVGADRRPPLVDVRVITATHRRLIDGIANRTFRTDLFYRLNVVHIEIPPLRERRDDVPPLLHHFLRAFAESHQRPLPEVTTEALTRLVAYDWPGNVREVRNIAERLVLKCRTAGVIGIGLLPREILSADTNAPAERQSAPVSTVHEELFARLLQGSGSFWPDVYEPFMARDLTRDTVRGVVRLGLAHTHGNYRALTAVFGLPPTEYKKLLNFLRKYQCHVPFQGSRMLRAEWPPGQQKEKASA